MMSQMRVTSSDFARSAAASGRPMSPNTFPLPRSIRGAEPPRLASTVVLAPALMVSLRPPESLPQQLDFALRRRDPVLGLLLEHVKHVDSSLEPDRVDATVGVPLMVGHNLENPRSTKPPERFCIQVLLPDLSLVQGNPELHLDRARKGTQVLP